jgi:hypothetical protein
LPFVGIEAAGMAFIGMYAVLLPTVYWLARRRTGFAWERRVYLLLIRLLAAAGIVFVAGAWSKWLGAGLGVAAAAALGLYGLARLGHMADLGGPVGRMAVYSRELMMKIGVWRE